MVAKNTSMARVSPRGNIFHRQTVCDPRNPLTAYGGGHDRDCITAYHAQIAQHIRSAREDEPSGNTTIAKLIRTPMLAIAVFPVIPLPLPRGERMDSGDYSLLRPPARGPSSRVAPDRISAGRLKSPICYVCLPIGMRLPNASKRRISTSRYR